MANDTPVQEAKGNRVEFEADRVAYLEVSGWRAYYDRRWALCFRLLTQLAHEQFHLAWPKAIRAAYYITQASIAWVPADHDGKRVRRYIWKFYRLTREYGHGFHFDPAEVTRLEYIYWVVHRKLSAEPDEKRGLLVQSLVKLHAAIFDISEQAAYESGLNRARSLTPVDRITGKRSTDIEADWQSAEQYLRTAYRSLDEAVHGSRS